MISGYIKRMYTVYAFIENEKNHKLFDYLGKLTTNLFVTGKIPSSPPKEIFECVPCRLSHINTSIVDYISCSHGIIFVVDILNFNNNDMKMRDVITRVAMKYERKPILIILEFDKKKYPSPVHSDLNLANVLYLPYEIGENNAPISLFKNKGMSTEYVESLEKFNNFVSTQSLVFKKNSKSIKSHVEGAKNFYPFIST
jgi:hypothetical protein